MITINTTLSIFAMLGISSLAVFWAKRLKIPHTVLLVIIGMFLGILSNISFFSFFNEFKLTPELIFYLFLPALIFESAYNINIRKLIANGKIILLLAVVSFLLSTAIISLGLYSVLLLLGLKVNIGLTMLFGALISATDPVAVLSLFKEYGVPNRLSLIFEGESLFNDATAVATFLIILEAIRQNDLSLFTAIPGFFTFLSMLLLGVVFGIFIGGVFAYIVGKTKTSETASITLTIVLAHITFILSDVISGVKLGDLTIHISPIISTTIASLVIGNYGRTKLKSETENVISKIWEQFAFMSNSLIFILIGLLIVGTPIFNNTVFIITLLTIFVVIIARASSIYPIVYLYNKSKKDNSKIPKSWQHLLAWGSLRGALAVTMVLLIPDNLTFADWPLDVSPKELLLSLTIGCIAFTLFIKAVSIKHLIQRFNLNGLTAIEEVEYQEAMAIIHHKVTERVKRYKKRGYIDEQIADSLLKKHDSDFSKACAQVNKLSTKKKEDLTLRVLRIFSIGIEKRFLKKLYNDGEVTEDVFRQIQGKLRLQLEAIEEGNLQPNLTIHEDSYDIVDKLLDSIPKCIRKIFKQPENNRDFNNKYMYYRAQAILSRKVLKELQTLDKVCNSIFTNEAVKHVTDLYTSFKQNSERKLFDLSKTNQKYSKELSELLATYGVRTIENNTLEDIFKKELVTKKLYLNIKEEID